MRSCRSWPLTSLHSSPRRRRTIPIRRPTRAARRSPGPIVAAPAISATSAVRAKCRLAGQREDYLAKALRKYKSGDRPGYEPAMAEVMASIAASEIPDLAHFLAHFDAEAD
jgi:hypothetical protein